MRVIAVLSVALLLAACSGGGEDAAFRKKMLEAISQAQAGFDGFWQHHQTPAENEYDFRVKIDLPGEVPPTAEGGGLWLEEVIQLDDGYSGLASAPAETIGQGDPVSFARKDVRDWSFVRGEELIGHYTTRVMLPRLPPEQADALKSMFGENPE